MSLLGDRKPSASTPARDSLKVLRNALPALELEPEQTPRIVDLRHILAERISELERQRQIIR
jgi:hypothetical protein